MVIVLRTHELCACVCYICNIFGFVCVTVTLSLAIANKINRCSLLFEEIVKPQNIYCIFSCCGAFISWRQWKYHKTTVQLTSLRILDKYLFNIRLLYWRTKKSWHGPVCWVYLGEGCYFDWQTASMWLQIELVNMIYYVMILWHELQ